MERNPDRLMQAYARLKAFRDHVEQLAISELYVKEYHAILDEIAELGYEIDKFRIPVEMLTRKLSSSNYLTGAEQYSKELYVEKAFFMMKLDGLLYCFRPSTQEPPTSIGFHQD
ncbi:MAG: hypothetical protein NT028_12190 [candidate division Zixibacteria bacterium]|nr:hypothetical protein [candidate division Zixibacteria bacterium]